MKKILFSVVTGLLGVMLTGQLYADPITTASAQLNLDNNQDTPFGVDGLKIVVKAANVSPDGNSGTTARASNDGFEVALVDQAITNRPSVFNYITPYDSALTDPWNIVITNGPDEITFTTPNRETAQEMKFAENISISGSGLSPTLSWSLPVSGPTVDSMRYQVWDINNNKRIFNSDYSTPTSSSEYTETLNDVEIVEDTNYAVRLILQQTDGGGPVTRSSNWISWTATTGEAEGSVLSLTTGSPAGVSQEIDTPTESFNVDFDYMFTTTTGYFEVFLDDTLIGTKLDAPTTRGNDFFHAFFKVDDPSLLGLTTSLSFMLDGPTGSNILIDNISFPGSLNGTFEQGLNSWTQQGPGQIAVGPVPEPATMLLFATGLAGLAGYRRKQAKKK